MKLTNLIPVFFLFFYVGLAQEQNLDSIKDQVENYKKRDTTRVQLLNQLTKYYITRDIKQNEALLNEAILISEEINYIQGLADSYNNLTSFYVQAGFYDKGLELALKAKKIQENIKDVEGLIYVNSSIARIFTHLEKPNKAIEIQLENLELLKNKPNSNHKASIHFYLASAFSEIEKYSDSEFHYLAAKQIAKNVGFKTGIAIANSSLGVLENKRGNYIKAINYLNDSKSYFEANKQIANIAHTNLELAVAYANAGRFNEAILINDEAILIYKKQNNLKNLSRSYYEQSDYYKRKKDYLNSSKFLEEHYKIKDSIFTKEKLIVIEEMQTKYEIEKTKREKEKAEQEAAISKLESDKNKNLFLWAVSIAGILLLTALFYFERLKAKKKAELIVIELNETQKRLAIEKQYRNSELKALKAQMNPHFIFNALNSIQDYIVLNQKNLASDYLGKFADLIRNYLHFSNTGYISIPEEVHNLNLYLELEKLRFEEQLKYQFKVTEGANSDFINIPTMLIQPYVENALKHGLLHKKDNRVLKITISKTSDKLIECTIEDNGIGREKSKAINAKRQAQHQSFALQATTERLELLNYGKEKKIGVEIMDLKENDVAVGTKVILQIPIVNK